MNIDKEKLKLKIKRKVLLIFVFAIMFFIGSTKLIYGADYDYKVAVGDTLDVLFKDTGAKYTFYDACSSEDKSTATIIEIPIGTTAHLYITGVKVGYVNVSVTSKSKLIGGSKDTKTYRVYVYNKVTKPKANKLTYNKEEQTGVNSSEYYTLTDTVKATDAGTYTATATLKQDCFWDDGTSDPIQIEWKIEKAKVTIPKGSTLTYNKEMQSGVNSSEYYTLTQDVSKKDVGDYTAEATINDTNNYMWSDSTTAAKNISWKIQKASVTIPKANNNLTYNKNPQRGIETSEYYTVTGDDIKTNAGSYTATVTLNDTKNYMWSDKTTASKNIAWTIKKIELKTPSLSRSYMYYTGREINIYDFLQDVDNDLMDVTNDKILGCKTYTINVSLKDTTNYKFKNGYGYANLSFEVKTVEITGIIYARKGKTTELVFGDLDFDYDIKPAYYHGKEEFDSKIFTTNYRLEGVHAYIDITGLKEGTGILAVTARNGIGLNEKTQYFLIIVPHEIDVPSANTNLVFNTKEITGVNAGTGYTISGNKQTNAGTYTATAKLEQDYMWSDGTLEDKTISWEIEQKELTYPDIYLSNRMYIYSGEKQTVEFTVYDGDTLLVLGKDYEYITGVEGTDAGYYSGSIKFIGNYKGMAEYIDWMIFEESSENVTIKNNSKFTYNSKPNTFLPEVKYKGKDLVLGTDYTISGNVKTNAGKYKATITFIGNFFGEETIEWEISKAKLKTPTLLNESLEYTGEIFTLEDLLKDFDDSLMTVYCESEVQNANEYLLVISLKDSDNYEFEDNNTNLIFTVTKATYVYEEEEKKQEEIGFRIDYNGESMNMDSKYEISFDGINVEQELDLLQIKPGMTYYIRKKGNENYEASEWVKVDVKERPEVDSIKINKISKNSIIVEKKAGYEYSLDGINWQDSNVFDSLEENTEYTVFQRVKSTDNSFSSEIETVKVMTASEVQNPQTGDNIIVYIAINILAVISLAVIVIKNKKEN